MNKFFKLCRDEFKELNKGVEAKNVIVDVFKFMEESLYNDYFSKLIEPAIKIAEPFVLLETMKVINNQLGQFRYAENAIGDAIVEVGDNFVVSIKENDGAGRVSIFDLQGNTAEASLRKVMMQAYIYTQLVDFVSTGSLISDEHVLTHITSEQQATEFFMGFIKKIRDYVYDCNSLTFLNGAGKVNRLDLSTGLPHVSNMYSGLSLEETGRFFYPSSTEFKNVFVNDAEGAASSKTYEEISSFNVTPERKFTIEEEEIMALNDEMTKGYVVSPMCNAFLTDYFDLYQEGMAPQSSSFYGPSGAGKTVMAQVIARELHRPYVHYKMQENSDEDTLKGQIKSIQGKESGNIEYEDSTIVKALKNGWVCEVQELSVCTNQGAETFFNPILDKTKSFIDASGNVFPVHPDALIIFTYNPDYCENNQIATSLLNRIDDNYRVEFPDIETCVNIFKNETGFGDLDILRKIYKLCFGNGEKIASISEKLKDEDCEEELSIRQVCNWIKRYKTCRRYNGQEHGWVNAAIPTIVNSLGIREPEIQKDIITAIEAVFV